MLPTFTTLLLEIRSEIYSHVFKCDYISMIESTRKRWLLVPQSKTPEMASITYLTRKQPSHSCALTTRSQMKPRLTFTPTRDLKANGVRMRLSSKVLLPAAET